MAHTAVLYNILHPDNLHPRLPIYAIRLTSCYPIGAPPLGAGPSLLACQVPHLIRDVRGGVPAYVADIWRVYKPPRPDSPYHSCLLFTRVQSSRRSERHDLNLCTLYCPNVLMCLNTMRCMDVRLINLVSIIESFGCLFLLWKFRIRSRLETSTLM